MFSFEDLHGSFWDFSEFSPQCQPHPAPSRSPQHNFPLHTARFAHSQAPKASALLPAWFPGPGEVRHTGVKACWMEEPTKTRPRLGAHVILMWFLRSSPVQTVLLPNAPLNEGPLECCKLLLLLFYTWAIRQSNWMGKMYCSHSSLSYRLNLLKKGKVREKERERTQRHFKFLVPRAENMLFIYSFLHSISYLF